MFKSFTIKKICWFAKESKPGLCSVFQNGALELGITQAI